MVLVKKLKGESEDKLIARFKKKILDAKLIEEIKERTRYKSPSEKRKENNKRIKHQIALEKRRNQN
jgi:ribosomal protein S21